MNSKNILVFAYALSPRRGSEYAVAWNYLKEMSTEHHITVLYGMNGAHMGEFDPVEEYQKLLPNVKFLPVVPNRLSRFLNTLNRKGILVYTFYFAYHAWQKQVFREASRLLENEAFDLIHYLGPIGYREPGYLWKLPVPYLWGPIGGLANQNPLFYEIMPWKSRWKVRTRTLLNRIQRSYSPRIRKAAKRADVLLAATTENQELIRKYFHVDCGYLPENGIPLVDGSRFEKIDFEHGKLRLIWVGRIDACKALVILIQALAKIDDCANRILLDIVGDGDLKNMIMKKADELGVASVVTWHGQCSREKVFDLLGKAHIHVLTSFYEGNPTVVIEAMSMGIPSIALDHCGMHDTISDESGIKIPVHSREQIVSDFANSIERLDLDRKMLEKLSYGALRKAETFTMKSRHRFFNTQYDLAIERFPKKQAERKNKTL